MSQAWLKNFYDLHGKDLPANYIVFDLETTGLNDIDLPTEIGHVIVRDNQVVNQGSFYLDWTQHPDVDANWFFHRLDALQRKMWSLGKPFYIDYELVTTRGISPGKALRFYYDLLQDNAKTGGALMGHNMLRFDIPMLTRTFSRFMQLGWYPQQQQYLFDTGLFEKARQMQYDVTPGTPIQDVYKKVGNAWAKGVAWKLSDCLDRYKVHEKVEINADKLHSADYDCYCTHLVYQAQKQLMEEAALCPA